MGKYNVVDSESASGGVEYPNRDGFGWTKGMYLWFKIIRSNGLYKNGNSDIQPFPFPL